MIEGPDAPALGPVTAGGRGYRDLPAPMREVAAASIVWARAVTVRRGGS